MIRSDARAVDMWNISWAENETPAHELAPPPACFHTAAEIKHTVGGEEGRGEGKVKEVENLCIVVSLSTATAK